MRSGRPLCSSRTLKSTVSNRRPRSPGDNRFSTHAAFPSRIRGGRSSDNAIASTIAPQSTAAAARRIKMSVNHAGIAADNSRGGGETPKKDKEKGREKGGTHKIQK